jgi:isopentenyl diphosphate isomerase/L-lactate dehydrogenase-like FMN-dependent dehydrogenase
MRMAVVLARKGGQQWQGAVVTMARRLLSIAQSLALEFFLPLLPVYAEGGIHSMLKVGQQ